MHVVVGHTRPIRQPFAGGLESMTWHLARGLVARGHHGNVFAARGSDEIPGEEHLWIDDLSLSANRMEDVSMPEPGWLPRHHACLHLMLLLAEAVLAGRRVDAGRREGRG